MGFFSGQYIKSSHPPEVILAKGRPERDVSVLTRPNLEISDANLEISKVICSLFLADENLIG